MWWTDGSRTDDGRVRAAAVCFQVDGWPLFRSYLGTGQMEAFHLELWAMGVTLRKYVARAEALPAHRVTTVAVFSDSQESTRWTIHWDQGPEQHLARAMNERARDLRAHGIKAAMHCVPGHSGIPGNAEPNRQPNKA